MRINGLDHINIQSHDLEATVKFYADVLDLEPRDPPSSLDPKRFRWMYDAQDRPIFHLTQPGTQLGEDAASIGKDTGAVHHVAIDCSGYDAMVAHLDGLGVPYRLNYVSAVDIKQIFLRDPNGVLLELNYRPENQ